MKEERINFSKPLAVKTLCLLRQAYMSTHRRGSVDEAGWDEIRSYYIGQRSQQLHELLAQLTILLSAEGDMTHFDMHEAAIRIRNRLPNWIYYRKSIMALLSMLSRFKPKFGFRKEKVKLIACSIKQLTEWLDRPEYPQTEKIFALEANMILGTFLLEIGCWFMPELTKAKYIEYYNNQSGNPALRLEEVLATLK